MLLYFHQGEIWIPAENPESLELVEPLSLWVETWPQGTLEDRLMTTFELFLAVLGIVPNPIRSKMNEI